MQKPYMLCIGHRGAMGYAPENTLASIQKALELGADYMEVDVYYVDGHLVVFHDDRLERITNGTGYLCEQTFDYIRSLDAGEGQGIPTLAEVCATIEPTRASINIELKGPDTAAPVAGFLSELIEQGWNKDRFLVSSFHHRELLAMKQLNPEIKLGALTRGLPVDYSKFAQDLGAFSVHPSLDFVNQRFVEDAHNRGLKVFVYAVDHPDDIARMHHIGVDGVFTGFPDRVLELYEQGNHAAGWN